MLTFLYIINLEKNRPNEIYHIFTHTTPKQLTIT